MSKAIIDETTLSALGDAVRYVMSDDAKRTPGEMAEALSGMQIPILNGLQNIYTYPRDFGAAPDFVFGRFDFTAKTVVDISSIVNVGIVKFGGSDTNNANLWIREVDYPDWILLKPADGEYLFGNCNNLQRVSFPVGFGSRITNLTRAFSGCTSLSSISWTDDFGQKV